MPCSHLCPKSSYAASHHGCPAMYTSHLGANPAAGEFRRVTALPSRIILKSDISFYRRLCFPKGPYLRIIQSL